MIAMGDLVRVAEKMPENMCHFGGIGCPAIVEHTYAEKYGHGKGSDDCSLIFENGHTIAWYPQDLLTLIEASPDNQRNIRVGIWKDSHPVTDEPLPYGPLSDDFLRVFSKGC